jgi:putative membrane protein
MRGTRQDLLLGIGAGVAASAATAIASSVLDRIVSREQKARDKAIREGSGHEVVARRLAQRIGGEVPGPLARAAGGALFATAFGVGWGLAYSAIRRRFPAISRLGGLGFAVPFFAACDGAIAPLLKLSPSPRVVPWQLNAKELANHVVWTATAEAVHRLARRY